MLDENVRKASEIMGRDPINPVGSCFDSSAFQAILGPNPPKDLRICHGIGIATMPGQEGLRIAHAWLEWADVAMDTTWGIVVPRDLYRSHLKIELCVEYSREEFRARWTETNFPGPWDEKIIAVIETNKERSA